MPRHPRFLHRLYARLRGYFWLPCPTCGTYFGGHEWTESIPAPPGTLGNGVAVCPWCAPGARRSNEEDWPDINGMAWIVVTAEGRTQYQRDLHDRLMASWVPVTDG